KAALWDERVRMFSIFVTFPYPPRDAASNHVGDVGFASTAVAENDSSSLEKLSPRTTMRLYTPDRLEEVFALTRLEPTLTCHTGGESRLGWSSMMNRPAGSAYTTAPIPAATVVIASHRSVSNTVRGRRPSRDTRGTTSASGSVPAISHWITCTEEPFS